MGTLGLSLPLSLLLLKKEGSKPCIQEGSFGIVLPSLSFPWMWLAAILTVGIFLRLFHLLSVPAWPIWDDAANCFFAIQQNDHWDWGLWFGWEKAPALSNWVLAFFFRFLTPSLFSMWFYPAILSILTLVLSYWACRQFFPASFSLLFTSLLAICFWPLYTAKFCIPAGLCLLWQPICIGLLGSYRKDPVGKRSTAKALGLGLGSALGLYFWFITPSLILWTSLVFLSVWSRSTEKRWVTLLSFLLVEGGFAFPLLPGLWQSLQGGHLHEYLNSPGNTVDLWERAKVTLSYLTVLFWGPIGDAYFCFGPHWGGFLNPILTSGFFLGLVDLVRTKDLGRTGAILSGLFLTLLPGLVSNDLEMFRICLAIPFVLVLVTQGFFSLFRGYSGPLPREASLLLLCFFSVGLDLYHLQGPFHQWAIPGIVNDFSKSPERYRAFPILDREAKRSGPGLVLTDFVPNVFDQSLLVATFPFNAARNPGLDPQKTRWLGLLLNGPQKRFLGKRFPGFRWYDLSTDIRRFDNGFFLGILPLEPGHAISFAQWVRLNADLQKTYPLIPYDQKHPDYFPVLSALLHLYGTYKSDRFLEAVLREKIADDEFSAGYLQRYLRTVQPLLSNHLANSLMFRRIGVAYWSMGRAKEAESAFATSKSMNPQNALPPELQRMIKNAVRVEQRGR